MESISEEDIESVEAMDGFHLKQLLSGRSMNLQHARIEPDTEGLEHSHPEEQLTVIVSGKFTLITEDGSVTLEPGDAYLLEPNEVHNGRAEGEPVEMFDIFSPARPDPEWAQE